jgi:hypothetical protein
MVIKPRNPSLANLTWAAIGLLALAALYVLSYAPVVRLSFGTDRVDPLKPFAADAGSILPPPPAGDELPAYVPVDWLIDHTPAQRPLLWWSELWGVRDDFEYSAINRQHSAMLDRNSSMR